MKQVSVLRNNYLLIQDTICLFTGQYMEADFNIQPLLRSRAHADLVRLVNGLLDWPVFLGDISSMASRGTRSRSMFRRRYIPTCYAYNNGLSRLLRVGSDAAVHVDFFSVSAETFRRIVASLQLPSAV